MVPASDSSSQKANLIILPSHFSELNITEIFKLVMLLSIVMTFDSTNDIIQNQLKYF